MGGLRLDFVDEALKGIFSRIGSFTGSHPGYFVIVPLLLTALAATGFQRLVFAADPEYLFSPSNGESHAERAALEAFFPTNYSDFEPARAARPGRFGKLIVSAADGGNILRSVVWDEISSLNSLVESLRVSNDSSSRNFRDLCATYRGSCWSNTILNIGPHIPGIEAGEAKLTYPLWFDPSNFQRHAFNFFFGGVKLRNDSTIESVKAVSLYYFLNSQTSENVRRGSQWEASFLASVDAQSFSHIKVARFSSLTLEVELESNTNSVIPYFALNIGIMIAFCIVTCMMTDWVKSKPLLGLFGVISAILATIFSFGFVIYTGVPFIGINLAAPFLMLGIGIDDTFVMLGAWRRSSVHDPVPLRMSQTYREAAVSITITSITDMLSFFIGVITPFPSVRIFCLYTGACVAFTYIWHVTFFGGIMAMAGYAEKDNRHSLTCRVVIPKSESKEKSWLYRIFCSGGISSRDPYNKKDNAENAFMIFFRDVFAEILTKPLTKAIILILFMGYLGLSFWGISGLEEGLERKKLARYDSYSVEFYDMEDTYFREYPYRVNVVLSGPLNYSDPRTASRVESLLRSLENTTFIDGLYTESWYRDFLDYVKRNKDYVDLPVSNEVDFIRTLREVYLGAGPSHVNKDVVFSPDNSSILASRFLIQGARIYNANDEKQFVTELRDACHASGLNASVYHPYFLYFDQFLLVLPTTVQCVSVAASVMMLISLIFIPEPSCCLWVGLSILSIEAGVLGLSSLWSVALDSISMINLIMCIGFSVDFSAHVSYSYMAAKGPPRERLKEAMHALGLPILQGAASTVLGVLGLALAPSYVFITFFKMVFLVILLGALHGLLVLPVLLSLLGPGCRESKGSGGNPDPQGPPDSSITPEMEIKIPRPSRIPREIYTNDGFQT